MIDLIKNTFKKNYIQEKFITEEMKVFLNSYLEKYPHFKNIKNIIYAIINDINFEDYTCKLCGRKIIFSKYHINTGICPICKMAETQRSEEYKEKIRKIYLEKYGVDHPWKSEKIKKKIQETNFKKYGCKYASQSEEIKEKQKQTCFKRYGKNYPSQIKEIREKQSQTCLEKYGVKNISSIYHKSDEFKEIRKNQTWKTIQSYKDYIIPLFEKHEIEKFNSGKIYKWRCVKCGNEFEDYIHKTMHIEQFPYLPRCLKCYPYLNGTSNSEQELINFCKQYFPNLKEHNYNLIKPFELDLVIEELKLAIEFNGSWYHSENAWLKHHENLNKYKNYHLNKVLKCNEQGYRLIHIWEDEWDDNKEEIKRKLIEIFEGNEKIDYSQKLDRSWYNNLKGKFKELPPEIIIRNKFNVINCGYLIKS